MQKNIITKIWDAHIVHQEEGAPDVFFIDLQLVHEVTSPQAFQALREKNLKVFAPDRNVATIDHSIPTDAQRKAYPTQQTEVQVETLRKNTKDFGIPLYDVNSGHQGIVHVMGPELGLTQPGMTICCGDSHTSTHGAFGTIAFGVGTTQVGHIMATSCLLLERPKTMKIEFVGIPGKYFSAKDAILALIQQIGVQGGTGYILEYTGEFIRNLSMEGRMTICNMSIECGARAGLIAPDETTFEFLQGRKYAPENFEEMKSYWSSLCSDENAIYDAVITVDITGRKPLVTWGTTPAQSVSIDGTIPHLQDIPEEDRSLAQTSVAYTKLQLGQPLSGVTVEHVFIGSCTNSRMPDLRVVAQVLKNRKVSPAVRMVIVPGSETIEEQAEKEGLLQIFTDAGAQVRKSGCSSCIAMNGDVIPEGERCASTSNRNFMGRQGKGSITHLMSPLMAAIAGVTGKITDPEEFFASHE